MRSFRFIVAATAATLLSTPALADAIEGNWKRPNGIIVRFAACGEGFCATAMTGPHAGGHAGKLSPDGAGKYIGSLTDLENNKTYSGKGSISGSTLTVTGCVLGGLFCRSEAWARQ
ncbi:MAG: DUF2147 domain-containing protein [Alphaproteobacteria bacterium]|nr:DUF2147 domain-containing protein [Alphaproteobacteria bacterium]